MANRIMLNETSYHGAEQSRRLQQKQRQEHLRKHLYALIQT